MVDIHQWCPVGRAHGKFFGAIADVPGGSHPATSVTGSGFPSDMDAVQTKQNLIKHLLRHRDDLRRLGVQRLGLFGSFQRGESDADNDVDLLVEFAPGEKSFDNFMAVSFLLEDELGRSVELVTPEALSPHIGPHILNNAEYVEIGA